MITINSDLFIGKGTARSCYIHKDNPNLCIKISNSKNNKQHRKELAYLNFLLKNERLPCNMIPKYYGSIETNLGTGLVFERIYNENGTEIKNLKDFISDNGNIKKIIPELLYLKQSLLKHKIVIRDLKMVNILVKESEQGIKLFLVDGIGNSDFIPLANYLSLYAEKKIIRRWNRFEKLVFNHMGLSDNSLENFNESITLCN